MKTAMKTLGAVLFAASLIATPAAAQTAGGAGVVMVDGPWVTLGEITGTRGTAASVRVAPSPAPGQRAMLNVSEVAALAKENGVTWDARGLRGITVERSAAVIPRDVIVEALTEELAARSPRTLVAEIANANFTLQVARNAPLTVRVENLDYDAARGTFAATVVAPATGADAQRVVVRGKAVEMLQVPALVNVVAAGNIIKDADVAWIDVRADRMGQGMATQLDQLVGHSPKRVLRVNEPVRMTDVQTPIVVAKNSNVTMIVEGPGLHLTAVGRALTNGGYGDVVQVMNTQTKTTVEGIVEGPGRVRVLARRPVQEVAVR
jgi:flagella basal body P-ring formation protein FlgA